MKTSAFARFQIFYPVAKLFLIVKRPLPATLARVGRQNSRFEGLVFSRFKLGLCTPVLTIGAYRAMRSKHSFTFVPGHV
jgi:hypothetical protein